MAYYCQVTGQDIFEDANKANISEEDSLQREFRHPIEEEINCFMNEACNEGNNEEDKDYESKEVITDELLAQMESEKLKKSSCYQGYDWSRGIHFK